MIDFNDAISFPQRRAIIKNAQNVAKVFVDTFRHDYPNEKKAAL